ncbi:3-hydroxyacyl-ACP dehydratase FabZ [Silanimonas sp.]|uniref:3-hydroxyacyl-ACP dehydratase FabZ n=1 Tax=Silanimonas sp. TaxID=1929290 RepID=UPI001BC52251|nr:3-hydroxyacyl-ACP dehydratase FabZ [Silanimonas sp.]MBS3896895.1 3-hydroxyacyl-ACP dehydratase FabZ [Silanimonas sp.]MBS3924774.1 3-hydroxyacyl-ACP dehydratase FabZ [Xanthomonadaceae bacterium]
MTDPRLPLDVRCIERLLPHRYPFLLIDRVIAFEAGRSIVALKNVTANEPHFTGHFPGNPVMPGVLVIEAMAQAGGLLTILTDGAGCDENGQPNRFYLVKVDKARFSRMVVPGDQLRLEVQLKRSIRNMALYEGRALVDGKEVASAEMLCAETRST